MPSAPGPSTRSPQIPNLSSDQPRGQQSKDSSSRVKDRDGGPKLKRPLRYTDDPLKMYNKYGHLDDERMDSDT